MALYHFQPGPVFSSYVTAVKIFYSWQSDTPNNVGKAFIREALDIAVAEVQEILDLDDAARPIVDQDTAGVMGSPAVADTILSKIDEARVVVADVTLTGGTDEGKRLINSNVAIELGYALGVHGDIVLLKIMNTHYGAASDLPFDLRHRRWPVRFELSPDASSSDIRAARESLVLELRKIIEDYVESFRAPPEAFTPTPSTHNDGAYWRAGEPLATAEGIPTRGTTPAELRYERNQPLIYLRVWPAERINPLTAAQLNDYQHSSIEPLCGTVSGWSFDRNRFGVLTYDHDAEGDLRSTTQLFKTGEIWGVNARLLVPNDGYPNYVPTQAFEDRLHKSVQLYLHTARNHCNYPPRIHVQAGLVNVSDFRLAMSNTDLWGPIYEDVKVEATVDMESPETINAALLNIYNAVFEAAGRERPPNLYGFPEA